jgi:hypothetical protein
MPRLRSNDESKEGLQEFVWAGFDITPQKLTCLEMVAYGINNHLLLITNNSKNLC